MFNFNFDDGPESTVIRKDSLLYAILSDSCCITNEDGTRDYMVGNGCRLYAIQVRVLFTDDFEVVDFMELPEGHDGEHSTDLAATDDQEEIEEQFAEIISVNFGGPSAGTRK